MTLQEKREEFTMRAKIGWSQTEKTCAQVRPIGLIGIKS
jgi:hypothetical protein